MSHTIQAAIGIPIAFSCIVALLSAGPVFYRETAESAAFQADAVRACVLNRHMYVCKDIRCGDFSRRIVCTSPEQMHFFIRTIEDTGKIILKEVDLT